VGTCRVRPVVLARPRNRALALPVAVLAATLVAWLGAATGARADAFTDAEKVLDQAVQTGGVPAPPDLPRQKSPYPTPPPPTPSNTNVSIRIDSPGDGAGSVQTEPAGANTNVSIRINSPGNDGPTLQSTSTGGSPAHDVGTLVPATRKAPDDDPGAGCGDATCAGLDTTALERELQRELERQMRALSVPSASPVPAPASPAPAPLVRPRRTHRHGAAVRRPRAEVRAATRALPAVGPVLPVHPPTTARPAAHRESHHPPAHRSRHARVPFKLPPIPTNQALDTGPAGGSSTPPPVLLAVLLGAACFAASMLVTALWDAHRRRRSRIFSSRLERPG
jgi:hypothetical protein